MLVCLTRQVQGESPPRAGTLAKHMNIWIRHLMVRLTAEKKDTMLRVNPWRRVKPRSPIKSTSRGLLTRAVWILPALLVALVLGILLLLADGGSFSSFVYRSF